MKAKFASLLLALQMALLPGMVNGQDAPAASVYMPYLETHIQRDWFTDPELTALQTALGYDATEAAFQTHCEVLSVGPTQADLRYKYCTQDDGAWVLLYAFDGAANVLQASILAFSTAEEPEP